MWLVFAIATALIWGVGELFYKKGNHSKERYSHLKTAIFVGLVMGVHAIIVLLTEHLNFNILNIFIYLPVSLCYIISMVCSYFGVKYILESISDPIENSSGAMVTVLCAVILHEAIQAWSIVAVLLTLIGVIGVSVVQKGWKNDIKSLLGKKLGFIALGMPFAYAILDAVGTFLDDIYLDMEITPLLNVTEETIENVGNTCYELTFLIIAIAFLIFLFVKKEKLFSLGNATTKDETNLPVLQKIWLQSDKILAAVCETAGQFAYVFAMSGNGAIAAPIIAAGTVVTSLLLSRVFLKEKLSKLQYLFIVIILLGILLLSIVEGD